MKKTNKIIALICMMAVLTMALAGCEFGKSNVNRTEINKKELVDYTEYVHSSGIKFSYPSEWKDLTTSEDQPVFGNTSTGTSVNYLSEEVSKIYNIDTYMTAAIENVKEQMDELKDNDREIGDLFREKLEEDEAGC